MAPGFDLLRERVARRGPKVMPASHFYEANRASAVEHYLLQRELAFIRQFWSDPAIRHGVVLDLCCGAGAITRTLGESGPRLLGLDLDLGNLSLFREHSHHVPLVAGDANNLPYAGESISGILAIHCFDQVDRLALLANCYRVLRDNGLFIFDAINRDSYKHILKRLKRWVTGTARDSAERKWIQTFSVREVARAAVNAGFRIEAVSGYSWMPLSKGSDSPMADPAAAIETLLRLDRCYAISPRVLVAARKLRVGSS